MCRAKNNAKRILTKGARAILVLAFWALVWQAASMLLPDNLKLFLPAPLAVAGAWGKLLCQPSFWAAAGATLGRIFAGFACGAVCGVLLGILTAASQVAHALISPAMRVVRAVPVVSFIILAYLFIRVDGLPIFISALMVLPLMWQVTADGLASCDADLIEMCRTFAVSRPGELLAVRLPLCLPEIAGGAVTALGFAWKSGVAAEVLCTPALSLGHHIYSAKGLLEFDTVYAVTLTVVLFSVVIEILLKAAWKHWEEAHR